MRKFVVIFILNIALSACGGTMKQYEQANIEILSVQHISSGGTEIVFRPIFDSLYYCPGVSIRQDSNRKKISFVRCGIKEKCDVDAIAEKMDQGVLKVVVPAVPESIDIVFGDGKVRLTK